jgi:uroporphyrinogen decarboxylase
MGGNIPLTSVMLHGSQQDNMKCAIDLLDAVSDRHNLIIAPGCDMPYDTPVENVIAVAQALHRESDVRDILKHYTAVSLNMNIELPGYKELSKPLIEVFTLDSATCAACTYMMGAAVDAARRYGSAVDIVEYKYTVKENIARCKKMGVPNLPSMYINGVLRFRSLIPNREELNSAIEQAFNDLR